MTQPERGVGEGRCRRRLTIFALDMAGFGLGLLLAKLLGWAS